MMPVASRQSGLNDSGDLRVAQERPHVVVLGAGFGGLAAARELRRSQVRVTIIDRKNYHLFQPLLYQVATAALNPSNIAMPIRRIFRRDRNVAVLLAQAAGVDAAAKKVMLTDGEVSYDYLIIATGATHSYFGRDDWAPVAPGLKTLEDALEIRRRVLLAYEAAERECDPTRRAEWMTFVIVGGGLTGVEMAGALADIAHVTLARDFRRIDPRRARIILVEALPRILPALPEDLARRSMELLQGLGVQVRTGARVTGIDERGLWIGDERVAARTVIWCAGVLASPLARSLGVPLDRQGRVLVRPDLTIPGRRDVFVIGDLAYLEVNGRPVPGIAPAAIQEGRHAARNVLRAIRGEPLEPFRYVDKGSLAVIGRGTAVARIGRWKSAGRLAWWLWLFVHLFWLIGFRNRILTMLEWAYMYFTWNRGARLITERYEIRHAPKEPAEASRK